MHAVAEWDTEAENSRIAQRKMHGCLAHRGAPATNENQRGLPSTFHEESTSSGTLRASSAPGRNVCVLTIVPTLHLGQLSLHTAALVVSETAWGRDFSAASGINDLQSSTLLRRDALASRP